LAPDHAETEETMKTEMKAKRRRRKGREGLLIGLLSLALLTGCGPSGPAEKLKTQETGLESEAADTAKNSSDLEAEEETSNGNGTAQETEHSMQSREEPSSQDPASSESASESSSDLEEREEISDSSGKAEDSRLKEVSGEESSQTEDSSESESTETESGSETESSKAEERSETESSSETESTSEAQESSFEEILVPAEDAYRREVFAAVSEARSAEGLPAGSWNETLAAQAQAFAQQLCREQARYHAYDGLYAESVVQMYGSAYETGVMAYTHCTQLIEDAEIVLFGVGAASLVTENGTFTVVVVRGSYEGEY